MAQLANCPHCEHELFVPDGAVAGAWARCPSCHAFFQLKDAPARELTTLEFIDSTPAVEESHAIQTISDIPTMATWTGKAEDIDADLDIMKDDDLKHTQLHIASEAEELDDAEPAGEKELNFDDLAALFNDDKSDEVEVPATEVDELPPAYEYEPEQESEAAELHVADLEDDLKTDATSDETDESIDLDAPVVETPEAAAQRIDAWFRSAKTLADVPALGPIPTENDEPKREQHASFFGENNATIDLGSAGFQESNTSDDFELDAPSDAQSDLPAWDDSRHMDQLLADIKDKPMDEFVPSFADAADVGLHADNEEDAEERAHAANEWATAEPLPVTTQADVPRRKKSLARMLAGSIIGGFIGIGLAYYALLWIAGPEFDSKFGIARYLPKAILPASFNQVLRQFAAVPPAIPAVNGNPVDPANHKLAPSADETANSTDATLTNTETPAETTASFTQPVEPQKVDEPTDNRYPATVTADKPAEPAAFDAPPAEPVKEAAAQSEAVKIANSPAFTSTDLSAALQAGKDAESGLVNGNLSDGREVARTKGFSYSILADLAQKMTFVDPASADAATLQQEADELFQKTLATPHAREEVGQIVTKWITSPNRRQGGVFFAGNITGGEAQGTVIECNTDLGSGQSLPVLVPATLAEQVKSSSTPVAVVGWIVDDPAKSISGYTGKSEQAVYATKLLPLE